MKLEDIKVGKQYRWNGRLLCLGEELARRSEQDVTVISIDDEDYDGLHIEARGSIIDPEVPSNTDYWLRPEDLSPIEDQP